MEQKIILVKTKSMSPKTLYFKSDLSLKKKEFVVVESSFGQELAEVVDILDVDKDCAQILRKATKADMEKARENALLAKKLLNETRQFVQKLDISMKAFDADLTLDEKKLVVFFTSEGRVDFRELVKMMASAFKKRIELHQVGPRDEVQKTKSIGICGRECCCGKFLPEFNHVSIKMAKVQGLSLMPNNITGACGKLLCCLEYENSEYVSILKQMPEINSIIKTPDGKGQVMYNNLLKRIVTVKIDDQLKIYPLEVVLTYNPKEENEN